MMNRITSLFFFMLVGSLFAQESLPDNARWSDQFFLGGFDGEVQAIEVAPNGNIFVGGLFNLVLPQNV